jgi:hypothetical protein
MKNAILSLAILFVGALALTAQNEEATGPKMEFESTVVDYGTIAKNSDPIRSAKFTNTGTEPLIIKNAKGSCGCTVPKWSKEPIMPGESSEIEIRYTTNRTGPINKTVRITTNEGGQPTVLRVKGKVLNEEAPAEPKIEKNDMQGN